MDKPTYADFDSPNKFLAIEAIIGRRLTEHPNAVCSYSGGSDSDIMLDLIERVRHTLSLPPVHYAFYNTGLEMKATRQHVKEVAEKYGVEIQSVRPKMCIVNAVKKYGVPFMSKATSRGLSEFQNGNTPLRLSIRDEFKACQTQRERELKFEELKQRYPHSLTALKFICQCMDKGEPATNKQFCIEDRLYEFMLKNPIPFKISSKCCSICKKEPAFRIGKDYDMSITGERLAEGGQRTVSIIQTGCFSETAQGFRLKPLVYVSDVDKAWYKRRYNIRYSDAYEVYGFTRTGCCGCPINYKAIEDLERLRPYEPNLVKAAWNVFGDSYRYRQAYNEYKKERKKNELGGKSH